MIIPLFFLLLMASLISTSPCTFIPTVQGRGHSFSSVPYSYNKGGPVHSSQGRGREIFSFQPIIEEPYVFSPSRGPGAAKFSPSAS
jgi:hypothetical protein